MTEEQFLATLDTGPDQEREGYQLRVRAKQGDTDAQADLGVMYANGRGVPQDDREAVRWLRLAAVHGDTDAQNNLGLMYANGRGVPQDDREAVRWLRRAAEQAFATTAQNNLGLMYVLGRGIPQDDRLAVLWLRLAAVHGDTDAQFNLERFLQALRDRRGRQGPEG